MGGALIVHPIKIKRVAANLFSGVYQVSDKFLHKKVRSITASKAVSTRFTFSYKYIRFQHKNKTADRLGRAQLNNFCVR